MAVSEPFSWPITATDWPRKRPQATQDRLVLAEFAVAGQGREVLDQPANVIDAMRPLRMARDLGLLPGREARVEVGQGLGGLGLQLGQLFADRRRIPALRQGPEVFDPGFQFGDGLFKIEIGDHGPDRLGARPLSAAILNGGLPDGRTGAAGNWPFCSAKSSRAKAEAIFRPRF